MPEEYINAQTSSDIAFILKQNIRDHHDSSGKALINCAGIEIYKIIVYFSNENIFLTAYR